MGERGKQMHLVGGPPQIADDAESVQEACRAEISAAGLSNAQAAHEMGKGVSSATLSRWLRGVYEGDAAAVGKRVAAWLTKRREAAQRDMSAAGLDRHVDLGVSEEIEAVLAHAQAAGDVGLIHGRSGAGKTWAARRYCARRAATHMMVATGVLTTLPGLLCRVAGAVGAGVRHPSGLAAETAVVAKLEGRGALLVVDEAHHLSPRLLDELRCIRDMAGCGLALIGGDELWTGLASSRRCDQILGRIGVRLALGAAAEADALDLACGVLGRAPRGREAKRILAAARAAGGFHAMRRLLARAWMIARADGREGIQTADVEAAAEAAA